MARAFNQGDGQSGTELPFVRRMSHFARLEPDDIDALCAVLSRPIHFPINGDLVMEGVPATSSYMVERGWACSCKLLRDGKRQILGFLLPGDCTAEAEMVFGRPTCSVVALTPVVVRPCQASSLGTLCERSAPFRQALDRALQLDLAILRDHLVNIGRRNAYERLAYLILELHYRLRMVGLADDTAFDMPITQEMMADAVGLSNVHVNRTLRRLSDSNIVWLSGGRLTIGDWDRLADIAEFHESYLGQFAKESERAGSPVEGWLARPPRRPSSSILA
jgi:CRP-like cAMP-binding protein